MRKALKSPVLYVLLGGIVLLIAVNVLRSRPDIDQLSLNAFQDKVTSGQVASATLHDGSDKVTGKLKGPDGFQYSATYPDRYTPQLTQLLIDKAVPNVTAKHTKSSLWVSLLLNFLPILLLFGGFMFILNTMQGGGAG